MKAKICVLGLMAFASTAGAQLSVVNYEDLFEGFYGMSFHHQGITYSDINQVSGVFPSGETFGPQEFDQAIIEDATFFYDTFPTWGSREKTLTFGSSFVTGDNLSLGRVSSVTMTPDSLADSVSMDIGFLENGPWGGIEIKLDAILNGSVVGSDSHLISDLGGRDNGAIDTLSIAGVEFDELHLYATFGSEFSLPRVIVDDLTLNLVPAPASAMALVGLAGVAARRRR